MITRLSRVRERMVGDDDGFTMLEVVVTMVIMAIVMIIFSTGISQVFGVQSKVDAASNSQSQLNIAFEKLDKQIRYASGISTPGLMGSDPVVEYLTSFTGTDVCTELRLHNGQLQQRTWTHSTAATPPTPSPTVKAPLASSLSGTTPFVVTTASATFNFQRLEIKLTSTSLTGNKAVTRQSDITFTALNTDLTTVSPTICTEGRSAAWA